MATDDKRQSKSGGRGGKNPNNVIKDIPYVQGKSKEIKSLPNYEGLINSPTANKFFELVKDKKYDLGAKGIGNWTSANTSLYRKTDEDSIDCSGAVCTVRNAQGKNYDLTGSSAASFKQKAKHRNIPIDKTLDGDLILMNVDGDGIDHIGFIVVDEKGRRYIAESTSSYNGTVIVPYEDRIADLKSRKSNFTFEIVSDKLLRDKDIKPYSKEYPHLKNKQIVVKQPIKVLDKKVEENKQGEIPTNAVVDKTPQKYEPNNKPWQNSYMPIEPELKGTENVTKEEKEIQKSFDNGTMEKDYPWTTSNKPTEPTPELNTEETMATENKNQEQVVNEEMPTVTAEELEEKTKETEPKSKFDQLIEKVSNGTATAEERAKLNTFKKLYQEDLPDDPISKDRLSKINKAEKLNKIKSAKQLYKDSKTFVDDYTKRLHDDPDSITPEERQKFRNAKYNVSEIEDHFGVNKDNKESNFWGEKSEDLDKFFLPDEEKKKPGYEDFPFENLIALEPQTQTTEQQTEGVVETTTDPNANVGGGGGKGSTSTTTTTTTKTSGGGVLDINQQQQAMDDVLDVDKVKSDTQAATGITDYEADEEVKKIFTPNIEEFQPIEQRAASPWEDVMDIGRMAMAWGDMTQDVPTYERGDMWNEAMANARAMKDMGFTPDEMSLYKNLAERGYAYDVSNIRRLAGGSAGVALGNLGRATSQLYGQYGKMAAEDARLRRQNMQNFQQMAGRDEMINRQIFQDDLSNVLREIDAAGMAFGDAMDNIQERRDWNRQYGPGSIYSQYYNKLAEKAHYDAQSSKALANKYLNESYGNTTISQGQKKQETPTVTADPNYVSKIFAEADPNDIQVMDDLNISSPGSKSRKTSMDVEYDYYGNEIIK